MVWEVVAATASVCEAGTYSTECTRLSSFQLTVPPLQQFLLSGVCCDSQAGNQRTSFGGYNTLCSGSVGSQFGRGLLERGLGSSCNRKWDNCRARGGSGLMGARRGLFGSPRSLYCARHAVEPALSQGISRDCTWFLHGIEQQGVLPKRPATSGAIVLESRGRGCRSLYAKRHLDAEPGRYPLQTQGAQ